MRHNRMPEPRTASQIAADWAQTLTKTAADIVGLFSLGVLVVLAYGWLNG